MGLSDRTLQKLKADTEAAGGKIYEEDDDISEDEITHFQEDSDPPTHAGEPVEDDAPVGEVPEGGKA